MKRTALMLLALFFVPLISHAVSPSFGAGLFAGLDIPLAQDDQAKGSTFGIRGIVNAIPVVSFEPHLTLTKYGSPALDNAGITSDLEGSKITAYGVNAILGAPLGVPGFRPFFLGGFGFYKATRDQTAAFSDGSIDLGWLLGLDVGIGVSPMLGIDLRGQLTIIPSEGSSSKKSASVTGGLTYFFGDK